MGYLTDKKYRHGILVILLVGLFALAWSSSALAAKPVPIIINATTYPNAYDLTVDEDTIPDEYQAGIINEAIFETFRSGTSTGTGVFESFLRVQADEREKGYNADAKNSDLEFDTKGGKWTHAIKLAHVPYTWLTVTPTQKPSPPAPPHVATTVYGRELLLDINEADSTPHILLERLQIWLTTDPELIGYDDTTFAFTDPEPILAWEMGESEHSMSILDYAVAEGSGKGDYRLIIPESNFRSALSSAGMEFGDAYLVAFAEFYGSDSGFEEIGIIPRKPATKSGVKFHDRNADGIKDDGEELLKGWTIFADIDFDGVLDAGEEFDVTDNKGFYELTLEPGHYQIREKAPEGETGWIQSLPYKVTDTVYYEEFFWGGEEAPDNDFGNWKPATKSGVKFEDMNADGDRDAGEDGLSGWTIFVDYDGDGVWDTGEPKDVTAGDGSYTITGIKPGTWKVWEELQAGWIQTVPVDVIGTVYYEELFESGDVLTGNDFGNWKPATKSGVKFEDMNADGDRDAGEDGLSGWTIFVDYDGDGVWDTGEPKDVTAGDGSYTLTGIKPGTWKVWEELQTGWTQTLPFSVYGTVYYEELFESSGVLTGNDFGNWYPATKRGTKFNDLNRNGIWDGGEPVLSGWTIFADEAPYNGILDSGEIFDITDGSGDYELTGLIPGVTYRIREVMQTDWVCSMPSGGFYEETFDSREIVEDNDFGNYSTRYETAWAYGNNENWDWADSSNWGWNNGPLDLPDIGLTDHYRWNLYAGAGGNDITGGTLVGAVYADVYAVGGNTYEVTVRYELLPAYPMTAAHVWIGQTPLPPKAGGGFTDAPGKLIYGDGETVTITLTQDNYYRDGVAKEGADGVLDLFIAAHAVVQM